MASPNKSCTWSEECIICCLSFSNNKKNKFRKVTCPYCNFECCQKCIEDYLSNTASDIHCMKCEKQWGRKIVYEILTKSFLETKWRDRKSKLFLEREKLLLLTETQDLVTYYKNMAQNLNSYKTRFETVRDKRRTYMKFCNTPLSVLREEHAEFKKVKKMGIIYYGSF